MRWHRHLYNSTAKERGERSVQLQDYLHRYFSEGSIGKSSHTCCPRKQAEQGHTQRERRARTDQRGWEQVHYILGQESEQRNQPTHPRARLQFVPDFSFSVPTGNGRTAMEDTFILQVGQKERSFSNHSPAMSEHVHGRC